jgi:hypothetical protein
MPDVIDRPGRPFRVALRIVAVVLACLGLIAGAILLEPTSPRLAVGLFSLIVPLLVLGLYVAFRRDGHALAPDTGLGPMIVIAGACWLVFVWCEAMRAPVRPVDSGVFWHQLEQARVAEIRVREDSVEWRVAGDSNAYSARFRLSASDLERIRRARMLNADQARTPRTGRNLVLVTFEPEEASRRADHLVDWLAVVLTGLLLYRSTRTMSHW